MKRHILWLSIDTYDDEGRMTGSHLGARSVETACDPRGIHEEVLGNLPASYRQLTGAEVAKLVADQRGGPTPLWEQLSIF